MLILVPQGALAEATDPGLWNGTPSAVAVRVCSLWGEAGAGENSGINKVFEDAPMSDALILSLVLAVSSSQLIELKDLKELPAPSVIIPLELDKQTIKATVKVEVADVPRVLCDIGISEELTKPPVKVDKRAMVIRGGEPILPKAAPPSGKFAILAKAIHPGEDCQISFIHGVPNCNIGLVVKFAKHSTGASCEFKPMFSLPSGKEWSFSRERGTQLANALDRSLGDAKADVDSMEKLRSALNSMDGDLRMYSNPRNVAGQARSAPLRARYLRVKKEFDHAQASARDLPFIEKDVAAVKAVGEYGEGISPVANIYVRFSLNGATLPATTK